MAELAAIGPRTMARGRGPVWGLTGLSVWLLATIHGGIHDASSRDCGVLAQVQCPEKTEGKLSCPGCRYPEIVPSDGAAPAPSQKEASLPGWN